MFGRLPVVDRSASSFACAACCWSGKASAGSMLSLVRVALVSTDCARTPAALERSNVPQTIRMLVLLASFPMTCLSLPKSAGTLR
jgi:hypothetical protein